MPGGGLAGLAGRVCWYTLVLAVPTMMALGVVRLRDARFWQHAAGTALVVGGLAAWAAWNAHVPADPCTPCTVSYCMSLLQGLGTREPFVVTLNRGEAIDPARVLRRMRYAHPVYTAASVAARARCHEIQGLRRTWFAGAYWGWGFHEDGIRSGEEVADALQAHAARHLRAAA